MLASRLDPMAVVLGVDRWCVKAGRSSRGFVWPERRLRLTSRVRRSGLVRNDDVGWSGCPCAVDACGGDRLDDRRADAVAVRARRRGPGRVAGRATGPGQG